MGDLFELLAVLEGISNLGTQFAIGVVDGVKSDGLQQVRIDAAVCVQNALVRADVYDLTY